jgi:hypothetical protein
VADWKPMPLPPIDGAKELRKKLDKEFDAREAVSQVRSGSPLPFSNH